MQHVICFSGQIFSGKDMAAMYLTKRLNKELGDWRQVAFGDEVKRVLADNFGANRQFIEDWKRKDEAPPGLDMTVRKSLMWIGDGFRQIRSSIWIDKLYKNCASHKNLIISDGRYHSEVASVEDRDGINIAIYRPGHDNNIDHPSESQLKPCIDELAKKCFHSCVVKEATSPFDFFLLNNSSLDDLYDTIEDTLIPFIKEEFRILAANAAKIKEDTEKIKEKARKLLEGPLKNVWTKECTQDAFGVDDLQEKEKADG